MSQDYKNSPQGKRTAQKYADIINLKRPASSRPKMDLIHRAKIFSPYDALRGYDEAIDEVTEKTHHVQRSILSEEQKDILSHKLLQVKKGMQLSVEYFSSDPDGLGIYKTVEGTVVKIDSDRQTLSLEETHEDTETGRLEKSLPTVIKFEDLRDIQGPDIKEVDEFLES